MEGVLDHENDEILKICPALTELRIANQYEIQKHPMKRARQV